MNINIRKNEAVLLLGFMKNRLILYLSTMIMRNLITSVCFNIVIAFITKNVFDAIINGEAFLIKKAVILAATAFLIGAILQPIVSFLMNKCVKETMKEIRNTSFEAIENAALEDISNEHSGRFISVVTNDINSIEAFYSVQMNMLVFSFINGIIAIASIFILEWRLAILTLLLGFLSVFINNLFVPKIRKYNDIIQSQLKGMTAKLIDIIDSIITTKMFQAEEKMNNNFREKNSENLHTSMMLGRLEAFFDCINVFFSNLKYIGVLCASLFMFFKGDMKIGTVMAVMQLMGSANYMFDNIGSFIKDIQKSLAGGKNVLELLKIEKETDNNAINSKEGGLLEESKDEMIVMKEINFSYPSSDENPKAVFQNGSMFMKKNKLTAITGSSGSGKSTVAKLLMRFYGLSSGEIYIQGKSINSYSLAELREKISYVPQNSYLFYGTIEENIQYGRLGASKEEIVAAAKAAYAHDFIMSFPQGYNTQVGEGGDKLSGGQRQRIAIARAFLKNAPILLLDEATASLDSEAEKEVQKSLEALMRNRTAIVIAHRLATIKKADRVYIFNAGSIELGLK